MEKVDAIVLAGDKRASKPIKNQNKAFLSLHGRPLVMHVVGALLRARGIRRVILVGPARRLSDAVGESLGGRRGAERVSVVQQGQNLLENAQYGFVSSALPSEVPSAAAFNSMRGSQFDEWPVLYLSCDLPLLTPHEVDQFLAGADMQRFDYAIGLTPESAMTHYYPTESSPGIRMAYYHLREGRFRHNNLHLGKPLTVEGVQYIERMYELRYQKQFVNIVRAALEAVRAQSGSLRAARYYVRMQIARWLSGTALSGAYERMRRKNGLKGILETLGAVMKVRVQAVVTTFGGAMLDVDNARDLEIIDTMYDAWMAHQERLSDAVSKTR